MKIDLYTADRISSLLDDEAASLDQGIKRAIERNTGAAEIDFDYDDFCERLRYRLRRG